MQNAFIESFNGRLRDELLNETLFTSLAQVRVALRCWRARLQRRTTTLATRMEDTFRVRLRLPSATGAGAALCQGLRASSRRSHRPNGQTQQSGRTQNWIKPGGKVNPIFTLSPDDALKYEIIYCPGLFVAPHLGHVDPWLCWRRLSAKSCVRMPPPSFVIDL
jgi:transposase InsO family protein